MTKNSFFFLLEIVNMNTNTTFEFKKMKVRCCNFNTRGDLILYCTNKNNKDDKKDNDDQDDKDDESNIVRVYSIQTKLKCQKIYMIPGKAEPISISKYDKIWLNFNDHIYEW